MSKQNNKATLLHEWEYTKERYRFVAIAERTRGYEDVYLIEKLGQDGLGEPSWQRSVSWPAASGSSGPSTTDEIIRELLVGAIKSLVKFGGAA